MEHSPGKRGFRSYRDIQKKHMHFLSDAEQQELDHMKEDVKSTNDGSEKVLAEYVIYEEYEVEVPEGSTVEEAVQKEGKHLTMLNLDVEKHT